MAACSKHGSKLFTVCRPCRLRIGLVKEADACSRVEWHSSITGKQWVNDHGQWAFNMS